MGRAQGARSGSTGLPSNTHPHFQSHPVFPLKLARCGGAKGGVNGINSSRSGELNTYALGAHFVRVGGKDRHLSLGLKDYCKHGEG